MGGAQNLLQDLGPPGILVVVRADHDAVFAWLRECWKVKIRLGCCVSPIVRVFCVWASADHDGEPFVKGIGGDVP